MLPPYQVFDVPGGKKIALIGVVTETTPTHRRAGRRRRRRRSSTRPTRSTSTCPSSSARRRGDRRPRPRGRHAVRPAGANPNGCNNLTGPIVDINNRIDNAVDLIVSAHTHSAYNCMLAVPGGQHRLVTSAGFYGRLVSDIRLTLDGDDR